MGVNKTSYGTYPTQNYTFQLNVWVGSDQWLAWHHTIPDLRKAPNGRFSPKLKAEKLTRTYAVRRRIIPSFQVIRPTWIDRWVLQEGDCRVDNTFPMKESNYRPQLNKSSQSC
jgi:hypothetical protein